MNDKMDLAWRNFGETVDVGKSGPYMKLLE